MWLFWERKKAQQVRDYLFGVTNGEREKRVLLAANAGLFVLGFKA